MRIWLSMLAVAVTTWALKAGGPLLLGDRPLPRPAVRVTRMLAPVLLAGLIVIELGGAGWSALDWTRLAGVATAGVSRVLRAPLLLAVVCGIAATAALRWSQLRI